jgi:hypothetical protein
MDSLLVYTDEVLVNAITFVMGAVRLDVYKDFFFDAIIGITSILVCFML